MSVKAILKWLVYTILMILLGIRVYSTNKLEGVTLIIFIGSTILFLYTSISFLMRIYRKNKEIR